MKKKFKIETFDYGVFYRWAKNKILARQMVVREIFGLPYYGFEHEHWEIQEVEENK